MAGKRIVVAGPGSKALVLRDDGRLVDEIDAAGAVAAVAASADGRLIAVAGGNAVTLRRADGSTMASDHPEKVASVAFAPDGERMSPVDWEAGPSFGQRAVKRS